MSLFLSHSTLQNQFLDHCSLNVSESIEHDCLSVLHKLHDQVNGLQLVQVVAQPLARLFNPAALSSPVTTGASNIPTGPAGSTSMPSQTATTTTTTTTYMETPDTAQALIARLDTDRDVNWLMEIIGYGLSMPFSLTGEQDSVKDCCTIYLEWLSSSLMPFNEQNDDSKYQQLSKLVPVPIKNDPNRYSRKMLSHLYNVFLPRPPRSGITSSSSSGQRAQADIGAALSRQAVLCHRVLRTLENIAQSRDNLMDNETWDHLLALLLTVNNKLLAPPTQPDIGTQLQDRVLGVLFDLMLIAASKSIPTSGHWRTFHDMCLTWRHRPALVDHWRRITLLLTKKVARCHAGSGTGRNLIYDTSHEYANQAGSLELAISAMSYENLSQTWYRFLNLIGDPVELTNPSIVSKTDEFANNTTDYVDLTMHECLKVLPHMFMTSMMALKDFVDIFLGIYDPQLEESSTNEIFNDRTQSNRGSITSLSSTVLASTLNPSSTTLTPSTSTLTPSTQSQVAATPTQTRKVIKSITMKGNKVIPFASSPSSSAPVQPADYGQSGQDYMRQESLMASARGHSQISEPRHSLGSVSSRSCQSVVQNQLKLVTDRPKCNSLLHLFGDWLFGAALLGSELNQDITQVNKAPGSNSGEESLASDQSIATESSGHSIGSKRSLAQSGTKPQQSKPVNNERLSANCFEAGQAEAIAILCRIFSSKTSSEDVSPNYLSRFYLCLQHCLDLKNSVDAKTFPKIDGSIKRHLLATVLINSISLFQRDLDGINLLIPSFLSAIEYFFECSEKEVPVQPPPRQHSRSSSIKQMPSGPNNVANNDLRRSCIQILITLLAYPHHFRYLEIRNCLNESPITTTFWSLRPRLLKLLFIALQTETDPANMQILFGGLSLAIHDMATNSQELKSDPSKSSKSKLVSLSGANELEDSLPNQQDDASAQTSFVFSSNSAFLIKSLHVTCHLLINIWKHDTQVSLAALDLLTLIARVTASPEWKNTDGQLQSKVQTARVSHNNNNYSVEMRNEYNQTTKWVCDYICSQCSRPPPAHSKDMHSTIVAAYQCLAVWFFNHPYLLNDENCLNTLMEVIELGVSGQKSRSLNVDLTGKEVSSVVSRGDKLLKPSSMRVKEAAESLLNVCMARCRPPDSQTIEFQDETTLTEHDLVELYGGSQTSLNLRGLSEQDPRRLEIYKNFKFFCNDECIIGLLEAHDNNSSTRDSVICLLRTPFGKHCYRLKFNYYTDLSKDRIISNRTLGLIKRPFQQCSIATPESRPFTFPSGQNKSLYFNNTAKFFPDTVNDMQLSDLDKLVDSLDDYMRCDQAKDSRLKNDLDKITKIFQHQILAEQNVMNDAIMTRIKSSESEEPQSQSEFDATRVLVNQLGLRLSLNFLTSDDKVSMPFVNDLRSLDHQPSRTCDVASIFYVRRNRTSAREILESVRERRNISLEFFDWLLELAQPLVVRQHSRWTGKQSSSWLSRGISDARDEHGDLSQTLRNHMLISDHGGSLFDGERMTLYWSDMYQELAFLVPNRFEKSNNPTKGLQYPIEGDPISYYLAGQLDAYNTSDASSHGRFHDSHNSDGQSICSVTSDASSQSTKAVSQQGSPRGHSGSIRGPDQRDSASKHSATIHKKKSTHSLPTIGCDTNIIICWLESPDDMSLIPTKTLLSVSENGYLLDQVSSMGTDQMNLGSTGASPSTATIDAGNQSPLRSREYAKYFISPMKNGLYRINLQLSFGRNSMALPLVDGMTISKGSLGCLVRESILNLCRRRRLDVDNYQPPHVRRRLKIQEICNNYKISNAYEPTEYYNNLFRSRPT